MQKLQPKLFSALKNYSKEQFVKGEYPVADSNEKPREAALWYACRYPKGYLREGSFVP